MVILPVLKIYAQPVWVRGTPVVSSTGPLSIIMNHGIDNQGTVYIIVYNYNNINSLTSSSVRSMATCRTSRNNSDNCGPSGKEGR